MIPGWRDFVTVFRCGVHQSLLDTGIHNLNLINILKWKLQNKKKFLQASIAQQTLRQNHYFHHDCAPIYNFCSTRSNRKKTELRIFLPLCKLQKSYVPRSPCWAHLGHVALSFKNRLELLLWNKQTKSISQRNNFIPLQVSLPSPSLHSYITLERHWQQTEGTVRQKLLLQQTGIQSCNTSFFIR